MTDNTDVRKISIDDSESELLEVVNKGQDLVASNYWDTVYNKKGLIMVTMNAGALRLLMPDDFALPETLNDYKKAAHAVLTMGSWLDKPIAVEIMLEDFTNAPHTFHLLPTVFLEGIPLLDRDTCTFSIWTKGPNKVCEMTCYLRRTIHRLPYQKPYKEH